MLGAGGYVAGPVGLAAAVSRMPLVLMEADSHLGLTNRLLAPVARRVCLAFPIDGRDGRRYRVTGRPVPAPATDRDGARARFGIGADEQCVLVFGGSQGARSINHAAIEAFAGARFRVICTRPATATCRTWTRPGRTTTCAATSRDFGEALLASDLVVARSGGSVFEIAAHGRPMVLIPYPVRDRRPPDRQRALHGARRRRGRDPRPELTAAAARAGGRAAARATAGAWRRWRGPLRRCAPRRGARDRAEVLARPR